MKLGEHTRSVAEPGGVERVERSWINAVLGTEPLDQLRFVLHEGKAPVVEHADAVHGVLNDLAQE